MTGLRVLVVDDDLDILEFAGWALREADHHPVLCGDPARLRELNVGDVDLAVVDLAMPEIDGLEAIEILKARRPDLPVVVWSAQPSAADLPVPVIMKPVTARQFVTALERERRAPGG